MTLRWRSLIVALGAVVASLGVYLAVDTVDVWVVGTISRCDLGPGYAIAGTLALVGWLLLGRRPPASAPRPLTMRTFVRWSLMFSALELAVATVSTRCTDTKALSYVAMMKADLLNLVTAETQ